MITARNIGFRYPNASWTFRDLSVTISPGQVTSLLGVNGAGKSTLLRLLAGITEPSEGFIARSKGIGFVPQASAGAFNYTVFDMVLMGRAQHLGLFSSPGKRDHNAATRALDRVGLSHVSDRPFSGLSGGQQQLTLIARALATGCNTLILDEPVSALDLRNQAVILELIQDLAHGGMSVVLSTHNPEHALHLGGQGLILGHQGELTAGPVDAILTDEALFALYQVEVFRHEIHDGPRERVALVTRYESVRGDRGRVDKQLCEELVESTKND